MPCGPAMNWAALPAWHFRQALVLRGGGVRGLEGEDRLPAALLEVLLGARVAGRAALVPEGRVGLGEEALRLVLVAWPAGFGVLLVLRNSRLRGHKQAGDAQDQDQASRDLERAHDRPIDVFGQAP